MAIEDGEYGSSGPPGQPPGGWPVPTSAYLHVPFCRHRCGYCNFSVVAGRDDLVAKFLSAIDTESAALERPFVNTMFLGGGTPTHLGVEDLTRLLEVVHRRFELDPECELSVEANPEDLTEQKLSVLKHFGVNRISIGVQSFDATKLTVLQRGHDLKIASDAIRLAADIIGNTSIDLIFGAPGESVQDWQRDLETAFSLPINHLSTYALTFEKGTQFWSQRNQGTLVGVSEDDEVEMYRLARKWSAQNHFSQYEISSFAIDGFRCRHNQAYWHGRGWYAVGPGAAAFVGGHRTVNHRSPTTYLKRILNREVAVAEREEIGLVQYARERAAFGVRLIDGIDLGQLGTETGVDLLAILGSSLDRFESNGLVKCQQSHVKLTENGIMFADTVASAFLG